MPEFPQPTTVFQANLQRLIGDQAVNAWAKRHKLEQTTINRIINGESDPKLSMILKVAKAVHLDPWQLLVPNLQPNNPPIIKGAAGETEQKLWDRIHQLLSEVEELRDGGNTEPGRLPG